ncbi:anchored repeat-type ABC transporter ATP-binding subunit [Virgisporangium aliadipatigenens]|uniref:anchored repeat-type ABC transporter ATP-binding subunit n=1 Tax=Virgisporangium aliadipatigenens TaxID=741659 RepID=UPI001EF2E977|nr:anchored repeat-type ABC transporter ATP-binding subunit [Virgisporangium aliadipatigenens]
MGVLVVQRLSARLAGREVLVDVDLRVRSGEIVGLIGPNGAGKTTLLRTILGLVPRHAGTVEVGGTIGYVPQRHEFAWDFPITVEHAVRTGLTHRTRWHGRPPREHTAEAVAALDRVGMAALRHRPVGELSGGQRQRVLVARALVLRPALLLLDEPFTGLDRPTRDVLNGLLRRLADGGTAVLVTTHDHTAANTLCDRIVLLNRTVVADAPPGELTDPAVWLRAFGVADVGR